MTEETDGLTSGAEAGQSPIPDTLRTAVADLAEQRKLLVHLTEKLHDREQVFKADNADLLHAHATCRALIERGETEVRALAVTRYTETGSRAPAPGVAIRMTKAVAYDTVAVEQWARESKMCLVVDFRAVEKFALVSPGSVPTARVTEKPSATIAKDLEQALAEVTA